MKINNQVKSENTEKAENTNTDNNENILQLLPKKEKELF